MDVLIQAGSRMEAGLLFEDLRYSGLCNHELNRQSSTAGILVSVSSVTEIIMDNHHNAGCRDFNFDIFRCVFQDMDDF